MKSILITGCSSGIGLDAALAFRDAGWKVIASCRKPADCAIMRDQHKMHSICIDYENEASITKGFADALRIGYQARPELFALDIVLPEMLYQEVVEIDERVTAQGEVLTALDLAAARVALQAAQDAAERELEEFIEEFVTDVFRVRCYNELFHGVGDFIGGELPLLDVGFEAVGPMVADVAGSADKSGALALGAFHFGPVAR